VLRNLTGAFVIMQRCSCELIEFLGSVINYFNTPFKRETLAFFEAMILPIHSHPRLFLFVEQVSECLCKMIDKQSSLLSETLAYLYSHWPSCDRLKQGAFLSEVDTFLVRYTKILGAEEVKCAFQILNYGAYNESSEIVDQTVDIIMGSEVIDIIMKFPSVVYPIFYSNWCRSAKLHWDEITRANALTALQGLQAIDPAMFKQMAEQRKSQKEAKVRASAAFQEAWKLILDSARGNDPTILNLSFPGM
jgi:hypothetical protein